MREKKNTVVASWWTHCAGRAARTIPEARPEWGGPPSSTNICYCPRRSARQDSIRQRAMISVDWMPRKPPPPG